MSLLVALKPRARAAQRDRQNRRGGMKVSDSSSRKPLQLACRSQLEQLLQIRFQTYTTSHCTRSKSQTSTVVFTCIVFRCSSAEHGAISARSCLVSYRTTSTASATLLFVNFLLPRASTVVQALLRTTDSQQEPVRKLSGQIDRPPLC